MKKSNASVSLYDMRSENGSISFHRDPGTRLALKLYLEECDTMVSPGVCDISVPQSCTNQVAFLPLGPGMHSSAQGGSYSAFVWPDFLAVVSFSIINIKLFLRTFRFLLKSVQSCQEYSIEKIFLKIAIDRLAQSVYTCSKLLENV